MSKRNSTAYEALDKLVLVSGHGVYVGRGEKDSLNPSYWITAFPEDVKLFVEHAHAGVMLASEMRDAALVFAGGQTKKQMPLSEAQSYWSLEDQNKWLGNKDVKEKAITEDYSLDGFQNLQFGIYRFHQWTGRFPKAIYFCGFGFKEKRYKMHAKAIGWDLDAFRYVPVNDPAGDPNDPNTPLGRAVGGEKETRELFMKYPLGDGGKLLEKRIE
ncbi:MAG: hypothetical protein V1731_00745, partial [Candidatus Aenigmatarchaeota archaeon]